MRYNGNGINSEFMKTLIERDKFEGKLKLPIPNNQAEIRMLSKFIFGVELGVNFEYCTDIIEKEIKKCYNTWRKQNSEEVKTSRFLKLYKIDPNKKDFITRKQCPNMSHYEFIKASSSFDDRMILIRLRYFCDTPHDNYYDHTFNNDVFGRSYELDSCFWRHCIGRISCGGIATYSYGQVQKTSYKEAQRLLNIYNNIEEPVSESFRKRIDKLILKDKNYGILE